MTRKKKKQNKTKKVLKTGVAVNFYQAIFPANVLIMYVEVLMG